MVSGYGLIVGRWEWHYMELHVGGSGMVTSMSKIIACIIVMCLGLGIVHVKEGYTEKLTISTVFCTVHSH